MGSILILQHHLMLQHHFNVTLRKLARQKNFTLLNILGLGLSVGCCLMIFTLLRYHFSFDHHHSKAERIVRVVMDIKSDDAFPFPGAPMPMSKALRDEATFVEKAAMRSALGEVLVMPQTPEQHKFLEKNDAFAWVEPDYFDILDLPFVAGDASVLHEPNTVVLTEKIAVKYFGHTNVIGQLLRIDNKVDLRVGGILRDIPLNTDYPQELLASWVTLKNLPESKDYYTSWNGARGSNYCFALLQPGHTQAEMDHLLLQFRQTHPHPEMADLFQYKSLPFLGMHYDIDYGFATNKKYLYALGIIGLFLLLTACVNFINMATAQALTRIREVGVRKALGSTKSQLFWQFLSETGLIVLGAMLVGWLLAKAGLPYLNQWLKITLSLGSGGVAMAGFMAVLTVLLTFLAGFYPGWVQARIHPVYSMKGATDASGKGGFQVRRFLVGTQFAISQLLIICAAIVTAQLQYAQDSDWGFRPGAIVLLKVPETEKSANLQQQIQKIAGVQRVTRCYQPPASTTNNQNGVTFDNRPDPEPFMITDKPADEHYLETFGLKLVAGRNLFPADSAREFIVNETFVKKLNLASNEDILNKTIQVGALKGPVIGVVKDFHNWSLQGAIAPMVLNTQPGNYSTCAVLLNKGNPEPALAQMKAAWEAQFPNYFYEHEFMDNRFKEFVESEATTMRLVRTFAAVAVFIGCMGLFGLSTFLIARKRKEIGIRKTLGANIAGILWLFGKEYARLIGIAFVVAAPFAWWVMNGWLDDYVYRVSVGAGVFLLALLSSVVIAVFTIGFQSVKAALVNPVQSLRSDE